MRRAQAKDQACGSGSFDRQSKSQDHNLIPVFIGDVVFRAIISIWDLRKRIKCLAKSGSSIDIALEKCSTIT